MKQNDIRNACLAILRISIYFECYSLLFYKIVCATLMTENKQQVVSEKSYFIIMRLVEKNQALPPESLIPVLEEDFPVH
jgi:hypothetical protein